MENCQGSISVCMDLSTESTLQSPPDHPQFEAVKETYGCGAECTEDGRDGQIGATKYAKGNGTRKRGGKAEHITQV